MEFRYAPQVKSLAQLGADESRRANKYTQTVKAVSPVLLRGLRTDGDKNDGLRQIGIYPHLAYGYHPEPRVIHLPQDNIANLFPKLFVKSLLSLG
jgi:hypothetical protein